MRTTSRGRLGHLRLASPAFDSGTDDHQLGLERCSGVTRARGVEQLRQAPGGIRVGVDLVLVAEVRAALARHGTRYACRLFSEAEIECCRAPAGLSAERLAARFAAKEAAMKVLEPIEAEGLVPDLRSIEVRRRPSGACELALHDEAAALAERRGIAGLALSVVHEGEYAAAVVVGWSAPRSECRTSGNEEPSGMHEQAAPGAPRSSTLQSSTRRTRKEH